MLFCFNFKDGRISCINSLHTYRLTDYRTSSHDNIRSYFDTVGTNGLRSDKTILSNLTFTIDHGSCRDVALITHFCIMFYINESIDNAIITYLCTSINECMMHDDCTFA